MSYLPLNGANASSANVTPTGSTVRTLANGLSGPFTLTGAGTSGLFDGQISVTGGGSSSGQGKLNFLAGLHDIQTYDGSTQFRAGTVPLAAEFWESRGGVATTGAVLFATNAGGTGNVDGVIATQGSGNIWLGNANGLLGEFSDLGSIMTTIAVKFTPSDGTLPLVVGGTTTASRVPLALIPPNGGALVMQIPDSTATGGNARGNNSIDLQQSRAANTQVASGANSIVLCGANNTAAGPDQVVGGFGNNAGNQATGAVCFGVGNRLTGAGASSCPGGAAADDFGNLNKFVFGSGFFVDNNFGAWHGLQVLHASTASTTATRLTAGQGAPAADTHNCANFNTDNTWAALRIEIVGVDMTTVGTNYVKWLIPNGYAARASGAASIVVAGMTATAVLTGGTGTSAVLAAITADTTNCGLNITVTAPNTNRWHWTARVEQLAGG